VGWLEIALCEGAAISQFAFENVEAGVEAEVDLLGAPVGRSVAAAAVVVVAIVMALLPAAVGLAIVSGSTVPLEYGAGAGLAIVAGIKVASMAGGVVAALRAPRLQVSTDT
jgi:hypothetical protein